MLKIDVSVGFDNDWRHYFVHWSIVVSDGDAGNDKATFAHLFKYLIYNVSYVRQTCLACWSH